MGKVVTDNASVRRIIGLTGGIATGKSTVSNYIEAHHQLPVLDADIYARQAVEKGSDILNEIAHRYGRSILTPDGTLNRPALGNIIFNDTAEKQWVEQQIHPFVRTQFAKATEALPAEQAVIYSIPLLFEANLTYLVTEIWVVYCHPHQQKQRLMERNQLTEPEAQARIDSQLPLTQKCEKADYRLDNSGSREDLFAQIDNLMAT